MEDELVVHRAQRDFHILVQLVSQFPKVRMVEIYERPIIGLVCAVWEHAVVLHKN